MNLEEFKLCIEEAIYDYKKINLSPEINARIEELEWCLGMLENLNNDNNHIGVI